MEPGKPRSKGSDGAAALVTKLLGKNQDASVESARLVKASQLLAVSLRLDNANSLRAEDDNAADPVTQKRQVDQVLKSASAVNSIVESQMRAIAKLSKAVERLERKQRQLGSVGNATTGRATGRPGTAGASMTRSRSEAIMRESGVNFTGTLGGEAPLSPGMQLGITLTPNGRPVTPNPNLPAPKNGGGYPTATSWSNADFVGSKVQWPADEENPREPTEVLKTLSGGGSGHLNSKTAVLMARSRQEKGFQSPYKGTLAKGRNANPVVSKWCDEYGSEQRDFQSIALYAEARLAEAVEETQQLGMPNRIVALKCCEVIEESAIVYGRFSKFLRLAMHQLVPCIFSGLDKAPPLDVNAAVMCQTMPTYFELTAEQEKEIKESKQEMAEQSVGLWGSAKARSKIFAFIFKNVFWTVVRLLFRGWKQVLAQKIGRIVGFQKRSHYRWFFVWRTVMRQQRALALQAAIMRKNTEEITLYEKEEVKEIQTVDKIVEKEVIVEVKAVTVDAEVQTDPVVISEVVEAPKITVSTLQKLKSKGKKAKQAATTEKDVEALPIHKGLELVTLVYEEKLQQDVRDAGKNIAPQELKAFCRDVLIRKYGIQSLAKKNMKALLATTKEGATRSKRLQLFSDLLAVKPNNLPEDAPGPTYIPEMVEVYSKLLRNLWGTAKKNTLTACFQASVPTVNVAALCKAVGKTLTAEQSKDPDGVKQLIEDIKQLPKTTIETDKTMSIEVSVDDSFLMIMSYWREKFQDLKSATAKGLWNSMLTLARGVRQCSRSLRSRKGAFRALHAKKYKIWEAVVKQRMQDQQQQSEEEPAEAVDIAMFTYTDFKSMVDDAFPDQVDDRGLMEYFMEWEERCETMAEERLEEHEEKAAEQLRVFKERKKVADEAFAKAMADAEEKRKAAIAEEAKSKEEADAKNEAAANPFGNVAKPAVKCECGNIFMGDSKFCRKCGKKRPHAEVLDDEQDHEAEEYENQCRQCGNIFMGDSVFCRKCGTPRPRKKKEGERDEQGEEAEATDTDATGTGFPKILFSASGRPIRPHIPVPKLKPLNEEGKKELQKQARLDSYIQVSWERHMKRQRDTQRREKFIAQAKSGDIGKLMEQVGGSAGGSRSANRSSRNDDEMSQASKLSSLQPPPRPSSKSGDESLAHLNDDYQARRASVWMDDG